MPLFWHTSVPKVAVLASSPLDLLHDKFREKKMWLLFWLSEEFNSFCTVSIYLPCSINLNKLKSNLKKNGHTSLPGQLSCFSEWKWWKISSHYRAHFLWRFYLLSSQWYLLGEYWTYTSAWKQRGCIQGCWGSWPMSLQGWWEGHGDWEFAGGKQTSCLLSGRARRRGIWGATGWSPSLQALVSTYWKPFPDTRRMRKQLGTVSAGLLKANHVCPEYLLQWNDTVSHSSHIDEIWAGQVDS